MTGRSRESTGAEALVRGSQTFRVEAPERCIGYDIHDILGQKTGSVEKLFVNESREPEYIRVRMGLFGLKSVLIPVGVVVNDEEHQILVLE
jgi:hypothetical protein